MKSFKKSKYLLDLAEDEMAELVKACNSYHKTKQSPIGPRFEYGSCSLCSIFENIILIYNFVKFIFTTINSTVESIKFKDGTCTIYLSMNQ